MIVLAGMGEFRFVGGVHTDLNREPFLTFDYNTVRGATVG